MDPEMNLIASGSNEDILKKDSKNEDKLKNVKLLSSDGMEFEVDYNCACQSATIKELLESSPSKLLLAKVFLIFIKIGLKMNVESFNLRILSKSGRKYMLYRQAHINDVTEEFFIEPELALDMMLAADYLDL